MPLHFTVIRRSFDRYLGLAENVASLILKGSAVAAVHYALIDDGEAEMVAVGSGEIATET